MLFLLALACTNPTPSDTPSGDDTAAEAPEAPDWAALLDGAWDGTETSASMGTQRGEYVIASADGERFDVSYAPNGEVEFLKLYFTGVLTDPSATTVGYVRLPDQIYAEGQTGPATLELAGGGTYTVDGEAEPFDGRIDLDRSEVTLEGTVTAFGNTEDFTFVLSRAR